MSEHKESLVKVLEYIVNDEQDKAADLLHNVFVEKAKSHWASITENDDYNNRKIDDVRKQRLTLKHINRLRKQREVHNIEHATRVEKIKKVYAKPVQG